MPSPSSRTRSDRAAWMAALAVSCLWGCDSFTPRKAPPPCDPLTDPNCQPPPDFFEPFTPEIVRDNIVRALEGRTVQPNYERSLAPGVGAAPEDLFTYRPDPGAEAQAPLGYFLDWRKPREVQFMLTLLEGAGDSLSKVELDFTRYTEDLMFPSTTNRKRYDVEYILALTYTSGDPPQEHTDRYTGQAKWDLIGGDRLFWTLLTWEDIRALDVPGNFGTMGTLRALERP